jgi:hypothetical protein
MRIIEGCQIKLKEMEGANKNIRDSLLIKDRPYGRVNSVEEKK